MLTFDQIKELIDLVWERKLQSVDDESAAAAAGGTMRRRAASGMPAAWQERQQGWVVPPLSELRGPVFERGAKPLWNAADLRSELTEHDCHQDHGNTGGQKYLR